MRAGPRCHRARNRLLPSRLPVWTIYSRAHLEQIQLVPEEASSFNFRNALTLFCSCSSSSISASSVGYFCLRAAYSSNTRSPCAPAAFSPIVEPGRYCDAPKLCFLDRFRWTSWPIPSPRDRRFRILVIVDLTRAASSSHRRSRSAKRAKIPATGCIWRSRHRDAPCHQSRRR